MSLFRNIVAPEMKKFDVHFHRLGFVAVMGVILTLPVAGEDSTSGKAGQKGRKYVNKIPYDVFFDNPLQVVNENKGTVAQAPSAVEKPTENKAAPMPAESPAAPTASSGGSGWKDLIPMEELQSEVKAVRNSLTKAISNQGQFNKDFKFVAIDGAELAAIAGIVQEHSESVSWKEKAHFVRDFSAQLNQSAAGMGKDNFDKTKAAFQKLNSVFEGSIPADAGAIPTTRPFNETANRKGLMKRIEKAKDWLKQDVNSEAKFKSMSDQIQHEAAIISALGTVITKTGYDYTENDDYQGWAKALIDGAREAAAASKEESYDRFKQSIDKINKSCTDCHGSYGNG